MVNLSEKLHTVNLDAWELHKLKDDQLQRDTRLQEMLTKLVDRSSQKPGTVETQLHPDTDTDRLHSLHMKVEELIGKCKALETTLSVTVNNLKRTEEKLTLSEKSGCIPGDASTFQNDQSVSSLGMLMARFNPRTFQDVYNNC